MTTTREEFATLAGGCFWCIEAVFELVRGVKRVVNGYAGGSTADPSYEAVCSGNTGHAEVVQITFDPDQVTYRELLDLFFTMHNPTTLNRQDPDSGTQYRSAVYYHDDAQRVIAEAALTDAQAVWNNPIVTEIEALDTFYAAEDYHQGYFRNNPWAGYCQVIIQPKVAKLRKEHLDALRV
ncbi:MAG: peptide-methionine (S)-S-oxide reductase MsrA [Chloroflexi bacterium]|nr:peptide-methionine (S)-S-oxide reductase MsrA [Chloroflexota bacterium]